MLNHMAGDTQSVTVTITYEIEVDDADEVVRAACESHEVAATTAPPGLRLTLTDSIQRTRERFEVPESGLRRALEWLMMPEKRWPELPGANVVDVAISSKSNEAA